MMSPDDDVVATLASRRLELTLHFCTSKEKNIELNVMFLIELLS